MIRSVLAILITAASIFASANTLSLVGEPLSHLPANVLLTAGMSFKEGDQADYKISVGGFLNGTMSMTVMSVTPDSVTIEQKIALMGQNQACTTVMNPNNGEVKSITCNGQAQNPPTPGDIEVIDTKEDTVTVPAGTFQSLYVKAHSKSQNQDIEQWVSPKVIPVAGMVKMITGTQLGPMNAELTSFKKN